MARKLLCAYRLWAPFACPFDIVYISSCSRYRASCEIGLHARYSAPPTRNDTAVVTADINEVIAAASNQHGLVMRVQWSQFTSVASEDYEAKETRDSASVHRRRQLRSRTKRHMVQPGLVVWELFFDVVVIMVPSKEHLDVEAIIAEALASLSDLLCKYAFDLTADVNSGCLPTILSIGEPVFMVPRTPLSWTPVILVPYSPGDFTNLDQAMESFANPFEPFSLGEGTPPKLQLVLAFSRDLNDYPAALGEVNAVLAAIETQEQPWTHHFDSKVQVLNCNNTDEQDMYDPSLQGTVDEFGEPVRWVSGPNRQFEKMMRWVMNRIPNGLVFMKEFDTVPQMDNHFGNLLGQINHHEPLYMLGR
jgi:hypothetical protein